MSTQPSSLFPASTLLKPNPTRTAANDVYNISELRRRILHNLSRNDLVSMLRVEKKGMVMVAQVLYRTVNYSESEDYMDRSNARREMYCDAVTAIDCRWMSLPEDIWEKLHEIPNIDITGEFWENEWEGWLEEYQPALIEVLVPVLRRKHPSTRRIEFGPSNNLTSWTVNLTLASSSTTIPDIEASVPIPTIGWIDHRQDLSFDIEQQGPPVSFKEHMPTVAPNGYVLRNHFDLSLFGRSASNEAAWLRALASDPIAPCLDKCIILFGLPVDLAGLVSLYETQDQAGHSRRLQHIRATDAIPFSIADFLSLARIASTSLCVLDIAHGEQDNLIPFSDLPQLSTIIRTYLPNLINLSMAMSEVESAEIVCQGMLSSVAFEGEGGIKSLIIYTSRPTCPLFNTARALSALLVKGLDFVLHIGERQNYNAYGSDELKFILYLRSQPQSRRNHLGAVDFSSLGYTKLRDVANLTYDLEGRPQHSDYTQAMRWLNVGETANAANEDLTPALSQLLITSRQLIAAIEEPIADDELASLRRQLGAVKEVAAVRKRVVESLNGVEAMEYQIEQAIRKQEKQKSIELEQACLGEQEMEQGGY